MPCHPPENRFAATPTLHRRRFLAFTLGLPFLPATRALAALTDTDLAERVPEIVRKREPLTDAVTEFRTGGSALISGAMEQYVQVMAEFAADPKPRLLALRWALTRYIDEDSRAAYAKDKRHQHLDGSVTSFAAGNYKCNKLVADAYAVGAGVGLSIANDWTSPGEGRGWPAMRDGRSLWPPKANELARAGWNTRSLTDARPLRQPGEPKAQPELGDLICFPSDGDFGHVCLYVGKDLILSAKETGLEIGPIAPERTAHGNIVRIRKFNGSGK
jgi:hypothetical protein